MEEKTLTEKAKCDKMVVELEEKGVEREREKEERKKLQEGNSMLVCFL